LFGCTRVGCRTRLVVGCTFTGCCYHIYVAGLLFTTVVGCLWLLRWLRLRYVHTVAVPRLPLHVYVTILLVAYACVYHGWLRLRYGLRGYVGSLLRLRSVYTRCRTTHFAHVWFAFTRLVYVFVCTIPRLLVVLHGWLLPLRLLHRTHVYLILRSRLPRLPALRCTRYVPVLRRVYRYYVYRTRTHVCTFVCTFDLRLRCWVLVVGWLFILHGYYTPQLVVVGYVVTFVHGYTVTYGCTRFTFLFRLRCCSTLRFVTFYGYAFTFTFPGYVGLHTLVTVTLRLVPHAHVAYTLVTVTYTLLRLRLILHTVTHVLYGLHTHVLRLFPVGYGCCWLRSVGLLRLVYRCRLHGYVGLRYVVTGYVYAVDPHWLRCG